MWPFKKEHPKDKLSILGFFPPKIQRSITLAFGIGESIIAAIVGLVAWGSASVAFGGVTGAVIAVAGGLLEAIALSAISMAISEIFTNKPSASSLSNGGRQFNTKSPTTPLTITYGECKIGGNWVFADPSAILNQDLHVISTWCEGPIEGLANDIDEKPEFHSNFLDDSMNDMGIAGTYSGVGYKKYRVVIDAEAASDTYKWTDDGDNIAPAWNATGVTISGLWQTLNNGVKVRWKATTGHNLNTEWSFYVGPGIWLGDKLIYYHQKYAPVPIPGFGTQYAWHYFHTGTATQVVDTDLSTVEPTWDEALRLTAYSYFKFVYDQYLWQSIPELRVTIKGLQIYDPRTGLVAYSRNPALVWLDMMTNKRYGMGINISRIDLQSVADAANWCETAGNDYYFDGAFTDRQSFFDHFEDILLNFRAFVNRSNGTFSLRIYADDAAVMNLTEDDIDFEGGSISIEQPGIPEVPNKVKCIYIDRYKHNSIAYAEYYEQDVLDASPTERLMEIALVGTSTYTQAKKLAKFHYLRAKYCKTFPALCHPRCAVLERGDMVNITHSFFGWTNTKVRVLSVGYPQDGMIPIVFQEEAAAIYDQTVSLVDYDDQTWYSVYGDTVADKPTGLVVGDTGADQETFNQVDAYQELYWDGVGDGIDWILQVKQNGLAWNQCAEVRVHDPLDYAGTVRQRIGALPPGVVFNWRVRQVLPGSISEWASGADFTSYSPATPDISPVTLTLYNQSDAVVLHWVHSTPISGNLRRWTIYKNTENNFATAWIQDHKPRDTDTYRDVFVVPNEHYYYWLIPEDRLDRPGPTIGPSDIIHYHSVNAPGFNQLDPVEFPLLPGVMGVSTDPGVTTVLHNCDSITNWTTDSPVANSIEISVDTTNPREGTGCIRIDCHRYAKVRYNEAITGFHNFGYAVGGTLYAAQGFKPGSNFTMTAVGLAITKTLTPGSDLTVAIYSDNGGKPANLLVSETLAAASVPANFLAAPRNYTYVAFSPTQALTSGTLYWLVLSCTGALTGWYGLGGTYYALANPFGDADEDFQTSSNGTTWTRYDTSDMCFRICVDGDVTNRYVYVDLGAGGVKDISQKGYLKLWARLSLGSITRLGGVFEAQMGEAAISDIGLAGPETLTNVWKFLALSLAGVAPASRNAIRYVGIQIMITLSEAVSFYIDYIFTNASIPMPRIYLEGEVREYKLLGVQQKSDFMEDFETFYSPSAGIAFADYVWSLNPSGGNYAVIAGLNGVLRIRGDGSYAPQIGTYTTAYNYDPARDIIFEGRVAQYGSTAGIIYYFGLFGSGLTDGIWFQWTASSDFFCYSRSSSSDTTLDTNWTAANGTFFVLRFIVFNDPADALTRKIKVFVNNNYIGEIETNIPTGTPLTIFIFSNSTSASDGMDIDYIFVSQLRELL